MEDNNNNNNNNNDNVDSGNIVQEYAGHNKSITCLAFYDGLEPA